MKQDLLDACAKAKTHLDQIKTDVEEINRLQREHQIFLLGGSEANLQELGRLTLNLFFDIEDRMAGKITERGR
jgi:hypothetical protein